MKRALMDEQRLRQEIVSFGRKMYERRLVVATDGNLSARLAPDRVLATPSGLCKGELRAEELVTIDLQGNHLQGGPRVSSEILMHLEVYRRRPEIDAVIHAHPPNCIALMLAGEGLDKPILAEVVVLLGKVPTAPFALPSTPSIPESISPFIRVTDCILLDHHGSLTAGQTLREAFYKLEIMEHAATSYLGALQTGTVRQISPDKIDQLTRLRTSAYGIQWKIIPFGRDEDR